MKREIPAGERSLVAVLAAIQFTHIMDFMIMMPLGPQLMRIMLISPQQFGLLISAYTITAAVAALAGPIRMPRIVSTVSISISVKPPERRAARRVPAAPRW